MRLTPAGDPFPPLEHLTASRRDAALQERGRALVEEARAEAEDLACPICTRAASELTWFYFRSPPWTWRNLCGRQGVVVFCDRCQAVVANRWDTIN